MILISPSELNPKLKQKYRNNATRRKDKREWREWNTEAIAFQQAPTDQSKYWNDTELFRLLINNHKTYPHMRPWLELLNTGKDSRYLSGIAGEDTLVLAPRESAKSTFLAQWIAQQLGRHTAPWCRIPLKILCVSYDLTTAAQRSRQIRAIIKSKAYQRIFPWVRPSTEKWGEREWAIDFDWAGLPTTEEQYTFVCSGISGAINSRRCVVGSTMVETEIGSVPISKLDRLIGIKILAFNESKQENEWCRLRATMSSPSNSILEIRTSCDRQLQCTSDHLVYVAGIGYKEAQALLLGDKVVNSNNTKWRFDTISSVEKLSEPQQVYDIEVENNHNFFGNDILLHNCHIVLLDDLIKSEESIESDSVRDRMVSNWDNVISYTRYDGSRAVCLGTRFRVDDLYCTTFIKQKGWHTFEQSALLTHPDGTEYSYWEPEGPNAPGTPLTRLQDEREKKPISFSFQRQNKIIRVQEQSIDPVLVLRGILPSSFETLVLGVDLSAGLKESNDYTAMVLGGLTRDGDLPQYWIIDAWEDRIMGNSPKLDAIIDLWETWKHLLPQTQRFSPKSGNWEAMPLMGLELWFDSSAYGLSFQGDYEDHIVKRNQILDWHVRPVSASGRGGKLERLRRHTGLFHNKLVYFNMYGRSMQDGRKPMGRLIQQITEFGSTSHDDLADAFELSLSGLRSHLPMTKGNY